MRAFFIFSFFLFPFLCISQNIIDTTKWELNILNGDSVYFRKPTKGDVELKKGNLKKAIEHFKYSYSEDSLDLDNVYSLACAYALDKQIDSAFFYLNIAILPDTSVRALNDPDFYFLLDDNRWNMIENSLIQKVEMKRGKYANIELSKELWRMKIKDQAFYYHLEVAELLNEGKAPVKKALLELTDIVNAQNVSKLEELISKYGWPKTSEVGEYASITVFLIIQHADIALQKKYLPVMREAADKGEANWSALALLIDRINISEENKQIYGSQIGQNEDGTYYVLNIEDPEYVNQRRRNAGLGPIEDYLAKWNIVWNTPQFEKKLK